MSAKTIIEQKEKDIKKAVEDFAKVQARLVAELAEAEQKRDEKILKIREEIRAIAMEEKLKAFPAVLVKEHKICSVCQGEMRPFQIMEGEAVARYWACQFGGLQDSHDLIRVP